MNDQSPTGCITRFVDGRCGNPPTSGLAICGSCLRTLLDEPDPRRRRTLAASGHLAAGVIRRLAEDPDDQVRAQVAARNDLDAATLNRLANPDREPAPDVWRSVAATPGGAAHAWELLGGDDAATLTILAANPRVDPDILEQLARHPNPDVSWTASATLASQPPADVVARRLHDAREFDGLPIGEPAEPLTRPGAGPPVTASEPVPAAAAAAAAVTTPPPATAAATGSPNGPGALPRRPPADTEEPRRRTALLVGAGTLVVLAAVVLVVAFTGGDRSDRTTTIRPDARPTTTLGATTLDATTTTDAPTTTTAPSTTTAPATTVARTRPPTTIAPPAAVTPPPPSPISQNFTITPSVGRFCNAVSVIVNFSPAPAYVVITDDTGAQVGGWSGASGQTQQLQLPRPTSVLDVTVTAVGSSISVSGHASGDSC